jgi:hypothetical protein
LQEAQSLKYAEARYCPGSCSTLRFPRTVIKGKRCNLGLGGLSVTSLAEARVEAARLRSIARKGGDPLAERRKDPITYLLSLSILL